MVSPADWLAARPPMVLVLVQFEISNCASIVARLKLRHTDGQQQEESEREGHTPQHKHTHVHSHSRSHKHTHGRPSRNKAT